MVRTPMAQTISKEKTLKEIVAEFATTLELLIQTQVAELARERAVLAIQSVFKQAPDGGLLRRRAPSPGRQLQGRYIGRLRKLKGEGRARVQRVARKDGIAAAIELADKLLVAG